MLTSLNAALRFGSLSLLAWGLSISTSVAISSGVLGSDPPTSDHPVISVSGKLEGISANLIYVKFKTQSLAVYTGEHTEVWKGKTFHDLSPLELGDDIFARCRKDDAGKLIALEIYANITNFFGIITNVRGHDSFELFTNPNADPNSADPKEDKIVYVDADTVFSSGTATDLKIGRGVQVVGSDLGNGKVRATRLFVYECPAEKRNCRAIGNY